MALTKRAIPRKYLIHFANEHLDFRIAELKSIFKTFNYEINIPDKDVRDPFMILELPSLDCVKSVASRAILIRSVYELWAHGTTFEDLNNALRQLPKDFVEPHTSRLETFKFQVTSFNKSLSNKQKRDRIECLPSDVLDFQGKVDLKNAKHIYHILEYYGPFGHDPTDQPVDVYFAKWITDGQRDKINEFHLQKRHFIANTSMDAGLSMIMANIGGVKKDMLVFDPFVGSGSLLVAAAIHEAYVLGQDLDYLLLHAKARPSRCNEKKRAQDESIRSNLRQYGMEKYYIDALVADSSRPGLWREITLFDAIITDPPYGIREGAKKVGLHDKDSLINGEIKPGAQHFPQRLDYHLSDIFKDLLNFSAKYLHKNGRLVYWFPVNIQTYSPDNIPTHPCLQLVHNCEQKLNTRLSRRLITMEKFRDFTEDTKEAVIQVDHFETSTFRDMYFNDNNLQKERQNDGQNKLSSDLNKLNVT
ncbi:tRNA methyltransferase 11 [Mactra antiquata]